MPKVRSKFEEPMEVPGFGVVDPDGVIDVPDEVVYSYTCQLGWEPVDHAAQVATDTAEESVTEAVEAEVIDPPEPPMAEQPQGDV